MNAWLRTVGIVSFLVASLAAGALADPDSVPAKTMLRLHLTERLASNVTKASSRFAFVMVVPLVVDGTTIVAQGAVGDGTVLVAGHAGGQGHEGDLTLRFDSVPTVDGRRLLFDDQRARINGRNRKATAFLGGLVPFAGLGAGFIRGSDIAIEPEVVIENRLDRPATIVATSAPTLVPASPNVAASQTPSASPVPGSTSTLR